MKIDGIEVEIRTLAVTDDLVQDHLSEMLLTGSKAFLHKDAAHGKTHLKVFKDGDGFYVRPGRSGSSKQHLDRCVVTFLDGKATVFQFLFAKTEYELRQEARLSEIDAGHHTLSK